MIKKLHLAIVSLFLCLGANAQVSFGALEYNPFIPQNREASFKSDFSANLVHVVVSDTLRFCPRDFVRDPADDIEFDYIDAQIDGDLQINNSCLIYLSPSIPARDSVEIRFISEEDTLVVNRIIETLEALELPFFDDFAYVQTGTVRPNNVNWLDYSVYINDHMGYRAPSIGVATFDGLNSEGLPYNQGFSSCDSLTSGFFDLSQFEAADSVILSFMLQHKGYGLSPYDDEKMILECKASDGSWERMLSEGKDYVYVGQPIPEFEYFEFKIEDDEFFHPGFQFRFRNLAPGNGFNSIWNVDYVRLETNEIAQERLTINDVAFSTIPRTILKGYTAIPAKQFLSDPSELYADFFRMQLMNHSSEPVSDTVASFSIEETLDNRQIIGSTKLPRVDINGEQNINVGYNLREIDFLNDQRTEILSRVENVLSENGEAVFETEIDLNFLDEDLTKYPQLSENGNIKTKTYLTDYYAYDDGYPEFQLEMNLRTSVAVEFNLYTEDTIKAVLINFPRIYADRAGEDFAIDIVKDNLGTDPVASLPFVLAEYPDDHYGCPQYTMYEFNDGEGVPLEAGKFFVVLRNQSGQLDIGFDAQSDQGSKNFNFSDGEWKNFGVPGTIMVRPVTSDFTKLCVGNDEHVVHRQMVYPNPATSFIQLQGIRTAQEYMIVNTNGQRIHQSYLSSSKVDISSLQTGKYHILIKEGDLWMVDSFIKL